MTEKPAILSHLVLEMHGNGKVKLIATAERTSRMTHRWEVDGPESADIKNVLKCFVADNADAEGFLTEQQVEKFIASASGVFKFSDSD